MVAQTSSFFTEDFPGTNIRKTDRTFVLELIDPDNKVNKAKVDTRLIDGNNHLHAVKQFENPLWYLKLEHGMLPEALKSSFTSFTALRNFVEQYYVKRGVKVTEVLD